MDSVQHAAGVVWRLLFAGSQTALGNRKEECILRIFGYTRIKTAMDLIPNPERLIQYKRRNLAANDPLARLIGQ